MILKKNNMRLKKQDIPFTMVANEVLRRNDLSLKAKGMYAYLFSKPDDYEFSGHRIQKDSTDGRHSTFASLKELENKGLLLRVKYQDGRMGYRLIHGEEPDTENPNQAKVPKYRNSQIRKTLIPKIGTISNIDSTNIDKESNTDIVELGSTNWILEEKLQEMEKKEGGYLDFIASFIREKPVSAENAKQLSGIIGRYVKVAKLLEGAYTPTQVFAAIDAVKKDNDRRRPDDKVDWTLNTVYKKLTK